MDRPVRSLWGLAAVGAATAVGITTHDAGFVVITLLGGLALPRILGLTGRRGFLWAGGCGGKHVARARLEERLASWHREAHADTTA